MVLERAGRSQLDRVLHAAALMRAREESPGNDGGLSFMVPRISSPTSSKQEQARASLSAAMQALLRTTLGLMCLAMLAAAQTMPSPAAEGSADLTRALTECLLTPEALAAGEGLAQAERSRRRRRRCRGGKQPPLPSFLKCCPPLPCTPQPTTLRSSAFAPLPSPRRSAARSAPGEHGARRPLELPWWDQPSCPTPPPCPPPAAPCSTRCSPRWRGWASTSTPAPSGEELGAAEGVRGRGCGEARRQPGSSAAAPLSAQPAASPTRLWPSRTGEGGVASSVCARLAGVPPLPHPRRSPPVPSSPSAPSLSLSLCPAAWTC